MGRGQEKVDVERPEEGGQGEEMRLIGEVFGGESAGKCDENESGGDPEDGGPGKGESQPESDEKHERREIGERAEGDFLGIGNAEIFPAARNHEGVGVKEKCGDEKADSELKFGCRDRKQKAVEDIVRRQGKAIVERGQGLVEEHVHGSEERNEETEDSKKDFAGEDAGKQEHLGFGEPDDGGVHAGIFEGDGGDEKDDADGGENGEGDAAFARGGKLAECEFNGAEKEKCAEGEFGADGLVFEKAEQQGRVEKRGEGGDAFPRGGLDAAVDVGPAIDAPIETEEDGAGEKLREHTVGAGDRLDNAIEPDEMIEIGSEDAENFELEPLAAVDNGDESESEDGEAGDYLRIIAEGVNDHDHGDEEEEDEVDPLRANNAGISDEVHREGDEEGEGPAAADEGAGEDTVAIQAFEIDTGAENEEAGEITEEDFFGIGERRQFVTEKKRNADDEGDHAEFVEPVFTERFLELRTEFARGDGRGPWRGRKRRGNRGLGSGRMRRDWSGRSDGGFCGWRSCR